MFHELFWGSEFIYGLIGCWLIIMVSKWLGKVFLQRPESFYSKEKD